MQVAKLSNMGYMLFWDSAEADRPMVTAAFNAVGAEDCIPTYDAYACSVSVSHDLSTILGLKDSNLGPIHISNLSKEVWGCNVARKVKGKTENQYPHLFSLGLLSDPKEHCVPVGIVKSSLTAIDLNKAAIEEVATDLYAAARTRIPAKDVSRSMVNWIYANKGIMLKDSGSLYFLDEATRPILEKLCTSLEKGSNDELQFTTAISDLSINSRLLDRVKVSLDTEIGEQTKKMLAEIAVFQSGDKSMRGNGAATRMKQCIAWLEKLAHYESLFGIVLSDLRVAVETAKTAVGVHGIASSAKPC